MSRLRRLALEDKASEGLVGLGLGVDGSIGQMKCDELMRFLEMQVEILGRRRVNIYIYIYSKMKRRDPENGAADIPAMLQQTYDTFSRNTLRWGQGVWLWQPNCSQKH
jgi:hypothetical protein